LKVIGLNLGKVTSGTLRNSSVILDVLCVNIHKIEKKISPKLLLEHMKRPDSALNIFFFSGSSVY